MSLRLAAVHSTSSSFASSSTPATTPVTPQTATGSSFHVFRATTSPPPLLGNGSSSLSRRTSEAPTTPAIAHANFSAADGGHDPANINANGATDRALEKEAKPPLITVDVEAAAEDARQRGRRKGRKEEEVELMAQTAARFAAQLAADQKAALEPDVETPFTDAEDVVRRLLPYHIFLHPQEDLRTIIQPYTPRPEVGKGKRKATEEDLLREEIAETKFALECWKRKTALEKRFRRVRVSPGKRQAPDDQAYTLAHAVLDSDRTEMTTLQAEYRNRKAELDRLERERKAAAAAAAPAVPVPPPAIRTSYYPPTSASVSNASTRSPTPASTTGAPSAQNNSQSGYRAPYRTYQYPYQPNFQQYTYSTYSSTTPSQSSFNPPSTAAPTHTQAATNATSASGESLPNIPAGSVPTAPIPVQLPSSSLASLSALGIIPVLAENAPPADQPQPAAVLKGTTQNGTMVSLEINVSALGAAQASGLAVLLSALTSRTMPSGANGASMGAPLSTLSSVAAATPGSVASGTSAMVARQNDSGENASNSS